MTQVKRIFVEKRAGFDVEAQGLLADLRATLGLANLAGLRLFQRYDAQGLSDADFARAAQTIFSEANVDTLYDALPACGENVFAVEYLPGQYDQRADSAAQCIALLTGGERPLVASARVFALSGSTSAEDLRRIQQYLVNPVESRIASMALPQSLDLRADIPENVPRLAGFIDWDDAAVTAYHGENGYAMTAADLCFCRDYFKRERRDPSETELRVIDTYWSDHCRHTTFLTQLTDIAIEPGSLSAAIEEAFAAYLAARAELYVGKDKPISLMDMATIGTKILKKEGLADDLDESEEINACSVNITITVDGEQQDWLLQFKNETHNHPTEIEPFGGAATCLGGAIRDPLSGRAYVYQAMRVTGAGDVLTPFEETMAGKLPQKKISTEAAHGYSSYGNQIGLATGQVVELYDPGYTAKRMEIGAVVGASPKQNVKRDVPQPGDVVLMLGGRTGRDGCGGATGSSKAHSTESIETCGAEVQKGNAPTERKLQRLFRNPEAAKLIRRCNDFGAGGVCVAIGELADGLEILLDRVPKKYDGLGGTELAISESQERMAVVIAPADADAFTALAQQENLEVTPVASVTENPRLTMHWRGDTIVDLSREFLNTNGVTQKAAAQISAPDAARDYRKAVPAALESIPLAHALTQNMARLSVASQKGLAERFDASIGAASVLMPFAGKHQLTPEEAMCAKLPLDKGETDDASLMSYGFIPALSSWSPFHGAAYAVTEALAKIAAVGGDPAKCRLTLQEYFERLRDVPTRWGKPAAALLGALRAQIGFKVPAIGGKDSMSGSFNELDVPPTLVCFAVGMTKASETVSAAFKQAGSRVALVQLPVNAETLLPDWDKASALFAAVSVALKSGKALSAGVVKEGGAAACVCKQCFGEGFGFRFADGLDKQTLFAPQVASFVIEAADFDSFRDFAVTELGTITDNNTFEIDGTSIPAAKVLDAWCGTLESVFPTTAEPAAQMAAVSPYTARGNAAPAVKAARPRVVIPAFPGTNCEIDTARAFERAGAETEILVLRNLTPQDIAESMTAFAAAIDRAQIFMLPGGFSAGDEPEGSGKFIATVLRNARIKDAVTRLLNERGGLALGICNGFQALMKTGLLPYGEIRDTQESDPTLTFNHIGRHVSQMVYTRIASVKSPWLSLAETGDLHCVPVSHGEGRFAANDEWLARLAENGQIATQYVDLDGKPTADMPHNPNGSAWAIEGITSPDGRVFGKMAHSERRGANVIKNVPLEKDQKIFESGVGYFK